MSCQRCLNEPRIPEVSASVLRKCAFPCGDPSSLSPSSTAFDPENWNCASMDILRTAAWDKAVWTMDQACAVLAMPERERDGDASVFGDFIFLGWYKNRGKTEDARMYEPGARGTFGPLTLGDVDAYVAALERWKKI